MVLREKKNHVVQRRRESQQRFESREGELKENCSIDKNDSTED